MLDYVRRRLRRIRKVLGIARDTWDILVTLGLASVPAAFAVYLSWARENGHVIFAMAIFVFAMAALSVAVVMSIAEKTRVFRRLKLQALAPYVVAIDASRSTASMTMRCDLVNRSQLPITIAPVGARLEVEGLPSKRVTQPLTPVHLLPNDPGYIVISTIQGVPMKPLMTGHLYLDVHYGMEDEDPEYRYEHDSDVQIISVGDTMTVTLHNTRVTHARIPKQQ